MKLAVLLAATIVLTTSYGQDFWIKRDSVNGPPRAACASFELNGEAFVLSGVDLTDFKRKMYSYDLEQDDWDAETALGGDGGSGLERGSAVGFSAGGYGFIGLGAGSSALLKDLWRYDPETEVWTQMADFEGSARTGAIAFSIGDIAYVGTGQDEGGLKDDFYSYNPESNSWTELNDFEGDHRKEAVGFAMGGQGYIGTGRGNEGYMDDFWQYNHSTDEWTQKSDFPGTPRIGAVGCGVFPSAFIMLGEDNDFEYRDDVWEYNYFGNVWTQRADYMGGARVQASAIAVSNRIFVGLGYDGTYHDDFYEYDRVLSMEELGQPLQLNIYPNPVSSEFIISSEGNIDISTLQIYNTAGTDVSNSFQIINSSANQMTVNLVNDLPAGNYFIALASGTDSFGVQQIIVR
ncbi:MAG: T9SS type A sorting domain-containing protein [Crocinitomix sp.]|nr:T9SS type A sorting domain-containing protein [Crocinitomix sp.]